MTESGKYIFGPVPSRRLGLSLGVDIIPFKTCSLDCVYCQLGRTTTKTVTRKDYVAPEPVLAELKDWLSKGLKADFITISGSGEPTLNLRLGELIKKIKEITTIPVAVLTNGTLMYRRDVRADCALADLVVPSLDAADEQTFKKINRPHSDLTVEKLINGLVAFRKEFKGEIWLEVFLIEGFNTDEKVIRNIRDAIGLIRADKVQINTAVRPTAQAGLEGISEQKLQKLAEKLGKKCEIVVDFTAQHYEKTVGINAENVLSMLKRRPCSLDDICSGLGIHKNEALKYLGHFQAEGTIKSKDKNGVIFFKAS